MRILLDYRPALRTRTGVGEYAHELASALTRQLTAGDRLVLFSSSWKDRLAPGVVPGADSRRRPGPRHVPQPGLAPPRVAAYRTLRRRGRRRPLDASADDAGASARLRSSRFTTSISSTRPKARRPRFAATTRRSRRRTPGVPMPSSPSPSTPPNGSCQVRRARDDRLVICPNGAPPWTRDRARTRQGHVLFMGTIEPRKNVGDTTRCLRRPDLAQTRCAAAGARRPRRTCLPASARPTGAAPLAGRVRHVGYVTGAERERLYREASIAGVAIAR